MGDITSILQNWSQESPEQRGEVVAALYQELRRNAVSHLLGERHVDLQPTSLVNEAYMRLINITRMDLNGRTHFMGLAGRIMREVLVDEARRLRSHKRDRARQTRLTGEYGADDVPVIDLLVLEELLDGLEAADPLFARLFEARALAGMSVEECAMLLEVSTATVKRKWRVLTAWLREQIDTSDA